MGLGFPALPRQLRRAASTAIHRRAGPCEIAAHPAAAVDRSDACPARALRMTFSLPDYLARIGLDRIDASADGLDALVKAQMASIPFENIEPLLGTVPDLSPQALWRKLVTERRGGYCMEQNALLGEALDALGFAARPFLGRVRLGAHPGLGSGEGEGNPGRGEGATVLGLTAGPGQAPARPGAHGEQAEGWPAEGGGIRHDDRPGTRGVCCRVTTEGCRRVEEQRDAGCAAQRVHGGDRLAGAHLTVGALEHRGRGWAVARVVERGREG